jgi:hypothetical protein
VLLHRSRERLVRQRTMLVNALRAHLAEGAMVVERCTELKTKFGSSTGAGRFRVFRAIYNLHSPRVQSCRRTLPRVCRSSGRSIATLVGEPTSPRSSAGLVRTVHTLPNRTARDQKYNRLSYSLT